VTGNQQRAEAVWDHIGDGSPFFEAEGVIAAALDEAEARGRAELAAKVNKLANEYHAEGRRRIAFAEPAWPLDVARRLRALIGEAAT
jgi:hypothetical protein